LRDIFLFLPARDTSSLHARSISARWKLIVEIARGKGMTAETVATVLTKGCQSLHLDDDYLNKSHSVYNLRLKTAQSRIASPLTIFVVEVKSPRVVASHLLQSKATRRQTVEHRSASCWKAKSRHTPVSTISFCHWRLSWRAFT